MCNAGLDYLHNTFEFIRDGKTYTLREAMKSITASFPASKTIRGTGTKASQLVVPHRDVTVAFRALFCQL